MIHGRQKVAFMSDRNPFWLNWLIFRLIFHHKIKKCGLFLMMNEDEYLTKDFNASSSKFLRIYTYMTSQFTKISKLLCLKLVVHQTGQNEVRPNRTFTEPVKMRFGQNRTLSEPAKMRFGRNRIFGNFCSQIRPNIRPNHIILTMQPRNTFSKE